MGVIYKLKEEVVEFILRQKQENPQISCRKLVDVIQANFQMSVSKSSINTIIKEANLSNPVGRTPLAGKAQFKIPKEKKAQLFQKAALEGILGPQETRPEEKPKIPAAPAVIQSSQPVEPPRVLTRESVPLEPVKNLEPVQESEPVPEPVPELIPEPLSEPVSEPLPIATPIPVEEPAQAIEEPSLSEEQDLEAANEPRVSLLPDPVSQPAAPAAAAATAPFEPPAPAEEPQKIFAVPRIGDLFLRCALWDLSRRPFLETFLKHHTDFSDEEIRILDALLCFGGPVFDEPAQATDPERSWLWHLSGFEVPPAPVEIQELLLRAAKIQVSQLDFVMEVSYFFSLAYQIKILLRDQSVVKLDSRMMLLRPDAADKTGCPMDNSVEKISEFIAERSRQTVVHCPLLTANLENFKNFVAACEGIKQKEIEKIVLCDAADKELSEFGGVPAFSRKCVVTTAIAAEQFKGLFRSQMEFTAERSFVRDNETIYWSEESVDLEPGGLKARAVAFSPAVSSPETLKVAFTSDQTPPWALYDLFVESEILDNKSVVIFEDLSLDGTKLQVSLKECLSAIKQRIAMYAQKVFLAHLENQETVKTIALASGYIKEAKRAVTAEINISDEMLAKSAQSLVYNINNYRIRDYQQRPLKLYIK
jgi:hypothetical protein